MGFFSSFLEVAEAAVPWSTAEAEGPSPTRGGATDKNSAATDAIGEAEGEVADESGATPDKRDVSSVKTVSGKEASGNDSSNKYGPAGHHDDYHGLAGAARYGPKDLYTNKGNSEEEAEDEEEEEEEEEDIVDPKETLEQECIESKECAGAKHHYDECAERVTAAADSEGGAKEDCVEEFFHLMHCATTCAAPKLWAQLK